MIRQGRARNRSGRSAPARHNDPEPRGAASRDGFVATVTIDKPPINAVSVDLMRDLADALESLDKDGVTRAVVLATAGKVFCSGADLSNRTSEGPIPERSINPLYDQAVRLFSTELPIIAAVQGAAIGGGLHCGWRRSSPACCCRPASMRRACSVSPAACWTTRW